MCCRLTRQLIAHREGFQWCVVPNAFSLALEQVDISVCNSMYQFFSRVAIICNPSGLLNHHWAAQTHIGHEDRARASAVWFCCEANWWSLVDKCLGSKGRNNTLAAQHWTHRQVCQCSPWDQGGQWQIEIRRLQEWVSCKQRWERYRWYRVCEVGDMQNRPGSTRDMTLTCHMPLRLVGWVAICWSTHLVPPSAWLVAKC